MTKYVTRPSWAFKVTVTVPCPVCNTFVSEPECKIRSEYVYGEGHFKLHSCEPCFQTAVKAKRAEVKPMYMGF